MIFETKVTGDCGVKDVTNQGGCSNLFSAEIFLVDMMCTNKRFQAVIDCDKTKWKIQFCHKRC